MIYKYNKLVRDKIPSEIKKQPGRNCSYFIMNDTEYDKVLDEKLTEELNEYKADHSIEELADLMEVIAATMKFRNISREELNNAMQKKREKKGGFEEKIFLKEVEEAKNEQEELHLKNKQLQLLETLNKNSSLNDIQNYFKEIIKLRNFINSKENISEIMLLLTEEVGELAKAIRKDTANLKIDSSKIENYDTIESEVADVFIVLNSICTALDINLFDTIYNKESINIRRKWENSVKKLN